MNPSGPLACNLKKWVLPRPPLCARHIPSAGRELGGCRLTSFAAHASVVLSSAVCCLMSFVHCQFFQLGVDLFGRSSPSSLRLSSALLTLKGFSFNLLVAHPSVFLTPPVRAVACACMGCAHWLWDVIFVYIARLYLPSVLFQILIYFPALKFSE